MINLNSLSKLKMTQEIIDKHISSTGAVNYFSGTKKEDGDIFFLGCLVIPDHPDLQIIADIPMKDIDAGYYSLSHVKVNNGKKLGYFALNKTTPTIEDNLKDIFEKYDIEFKLEIMKAKIDEEIRIRNEE